MNTRKRFLKVAWIFTKILFDFRKEGKLIKKKGFQYANNKMQKRHRKRAEELFNLATSLGGILIKLCQLISTRRDCFPAPYIEILSHLQDEVPPTDFSEIEKIIKKEYKNYNTIFKKIDKDPIASASIAQVHMAVLNDDTVAILKILKPGVEELIDIDFAILYLVLKLSSHIQFIRDRIDFESVIDEFVVITGDELNYRREVYLAKKFKKAFKKFKYVTIPEIFDEYCTDRIIVMQYIDGDRITDIDKWRKKGNDPIILSKRLIEIYMEQFLFTRLIHYDPHPGNLLVLENNHIALIDFGMAGDISEEMSNNIKSVLIATINHDYEKILITLDKMGFFIQGTDIYSILPIVEFLLEKVLPSITLERESFYNINLSPILDELIEFIYINPVKFPTNWAYIGKTTGTLVGIISSLYPDIDFMAEIKPYFKKLLKENAIGNVNTIFRIVKNNMKDTFILPGKINSLIQKIERENANLRFGQDTLNQKIDSLQTTIVRGISISLCLLSSFFVYILFILKQNSGVKIFIITGVISFLVSLLYRKEAKKTILKKAIKKQPIFYD